MHIVHLWLKETLKDKQKDLYTFSIWDSLEFEKKYILLFYFQSQSYRGASSIFCEPEKNDRL